MASAGGGGAGTWKTDRLHLRPWARDDVDRFLDLYGRLAVMRWLGDGPPRVITERDEALRAIERWSARELRAPHGTWALQPLEGGPVVGTLSLATLPRSTHGETEIAWHLHPDSWGRGYASEAARSVLARAFAGGLPEVLAVTHVGNDASARVCQALGMRHEGVVEGPWYDVPMELYRLPAPGDYGTEND